MIKSGKVKRVVYHPFAQQGEGFKRAFCNSRIVFFFYQGPGNTPPFFFILCAEGGMIAHPRTGRILKHDYLGIGWMELAETWYSYRPIYT
jgi:hypothetical protein